MTSVVNQRSLFGKTNGKYISEYKQVDTVSDIDGNYYYLTLSETPGSYPDVPADIIVSTDADPSVTTDHLNEKTGGSVGPGIGEFRVEGQRVYFPKSSAGLSFWFFYYGVGDTVKAEDNNNLETRILALEAGGSGGGGDPGSGLTSYQNALMSEWSREYYGGL